MSKSIDQAKLIAIVQSIALSESGGARLLDRLRTVVAEVDRFHFFRYERKKAQLATARWEMEAYRKTINWLIQIKGNCMHAEKVKVVLLTRGKVVPEDIRNSEK